jgi:hypothetical protein
VRTKVTLVLLFLNVALFFFIFQFERRWRTEENWKEARRRVLGPEAADIRALEITSASHRLALEKRGDTWFITHPLEWPANPNAVNRIVNDLQFLEHETSFQVRDLEKNGQSLSDYGLDQPKLTVAFSSGSSTLQTQSSTPNHTTTLQLGDTTKDNLRLYVLSPDGSRIHVVNQSLARSLALTFEELHADSLFTIPVFEARSLNLQTAPPASLRIRLRRDGSRWTFEAPIIARASKNATELAINALNALRVRSFATTDAPTPPPSERPSLRISLEGNSRRETLLLGPALGNTALPTGAATTPDVEYYAQLEGRDAVFTVAIPAALKSVLDRAQETLRDSRILDFDPRAVTSVTLSAPNQPPLTLQRLETSTQPGAAAWQIVLRGDTAQGPQTLPADRDAVTRLLEQLSLLSAQRFESDAPRDADLEAWGFNRPEREIALNIPGAPPLTLQIGLPAQRGTAAFARSSTSPSVYAIDQEFLRELPVAARAWRERLLRELPAGARIAALKLTDLSDQSVVLETTLDPAGRPTTAVSQSDALQTILTHLRSLRAAEFVADQFAERITVAGEDRPWRYRLDATITLVGGAAEQTSTTTLFLSPRVGGSRQLAGSPPGEFNVIFAIEQPFLDALWTLIQSPRDPGPPPPPPSA